MRSFEDVDELLEFICSLDGYGLVVTDEKLLEHSISIVEIFAEEDPS